MKCLSDISSEEVRSRAGQSLGVLIQLNPRVDTLLTDLAAGVRGETKQPDGDSNGGVSDDAKEEIQLSMVQALAEVLKKIPEDKIKEGPVFGKIYDSLMVLFIFFLMCYSNCFYSNYTLLHSTRKICTRGIVLPEHVYSLRAFEPL